MKYGYNSQERSGESSFDTLLFNSDFNFSVHGHPEFELTYIISGEGTRIVGSQVEKYNGNELILLGPYLPHGWTSFDHPAKTTSASVIQWKKDFLGSNWYEIKEFGLIKNLLLRSVNGIKFGEKTASLVKDRLLLITTQPPLDKLITLLKILRELAYTNDYTIICSEEISYPSQSEQFLLEEIKEDLKK